MYRILGTSEEDDTASTNGANENTEEEERSGEADTHLHDYNPEIFDDDDFYHQVYTHIFTHTERERVWILKFEHALKLDSIIYSGV